ncbi:Phage terminase, large subunit [Escherichia coli O157:H7 str. EC1212]|nr:Phage terminase, large subunit [Escherichia coli O157:H7 str. EC1212]
MTPVEWADQNYYLPKESSYGEGEWKTLPFQIAIMNSMGNDQIREPPRKSWRLNSLRKR